VTQHQPVSEKRPSRILTFFTTLPGVLTAVATLITAVGGLIVVLDGLGEDEQRPPAGGSDTSVSTTSPAQRTSLQPSSDGGSPGPAQTVDLDPSAVRLKKTLHAALNDIVFLSDGRAGLEWGDGNDFKIDSFEVTKQVRLYGGKPILATFASIDGTVDKRSCAGRLGERPVSNFFVKQEHEGRWICVLTARDTIAAMRFDEVDLVSGGLTITYAIWR
jgi:hypothetical protein